MNHVEQLITSTEARRVAALTTIGGKRQADLGQFFTPAPAAELIASMVELPNKGRLRVLDPGAGSGSLSAALVARVLREAPHLRVELVAQELDDDVAVSLRETLEDCQLTATALGTELSFDMVGGDFIADADNLGSDFDVVIMNPPYLKIPANSVNRALMAARGIDAGNLYAAFLGLGVLALRAGGQVVAITPRSFTNGPYFEQFRGFLLERVALRQIHIFGSRKTVFADTGVLQENIIVAAVRGTKPGDVSISTSTGHEDEVTTQLLPFEQIVHSDDVNSFIRIPSAEGAGLAVEAMLALPATLADLGVKVSTGRVVDFRQRNNIGAEDDSTFPMVYPTNIRRGVVVHPLATAKGQGFRALQPKEANMLVPPGNYVIIKRFSSKEERRRVVAGVWLDDGRSVAFDNKTNFIHVHGAGLERGLAIGLSIWLNSTVVDTFFRTFSGHTQVNATDLRSMRFPAADDLHALGKGRSAELPPQEDIDLLVSTMLGELVAA